MREWTCKFFDISWRWVVSFATRPIYTLGTSPRYPVYRLGGLRIGLDDAKKRKFLTLPELELRPLGRPACLGLDCMVRIHSALNRDHGGLLWTLPPPPPPPTFFSPHLLEHGASMKLPVSLQFLNLGQSVGLLERVISSSQDLYLHRTTQIE
jgi:hypothetical protein